MPDEGANPFAQIAQALQWDRSRWVWLLGAVLALDLVLGLGDSVAAILRYDRSAIAGGGWWRLLTAHIVHLDWHHLLLNELGLVLIWALFAGDFDPLEWCIIVLSGALAISSGLWWLSPRVSWYVGLSGVLHAMMGPGIAGFCSRVSRPSSLMNSSAAASPLWWWWTRTSTERLAGSSWGLFCPGVWL
jgi:rhomboid family GlyGly-CTERM serine protease